MRLVFACVFSGPLSDAGETTRPGVDLALKNSMKWNCSVEAPGVEPGGDFTKTRVITRRFSYSPNATWCPMRTSDYRQFRMRVDALGNNLGTNGIDSISSTAPAMSAEWDAQFLHPVPQGLGMDFE
jgi:hypothetical protein